MKQSTLNLVEKLRKEGNYQLAQKVLELDFAIFKWTEQVNNLVEASEMPNDYHYDHYVDALMEGGEK